jgi:hypothetical protein
MKPIYQLLVVVFFISACQEEDPSYLFEVENVQVKPSSANKDRLKTDIEFVSIAYNDLFGTNISQSELDNVITTYQSFGDKSLVIELIIRKFVFSDQSNISQIDRSSDASIEAFVQQAYEKVYNRTPNSFEKWYLTDFLKSNENVNSQLFYYAIMTANEYRYY